MFLGMALALAATPLLVDALSLSGAMGVFAGVSVAAALLFVWQAEERGGGEIQNASAGFRQVLGRDLVLVFAMAFLGLGYFNGITTWLELIVAPNGIDAMRAGVLGGVLMLSGIVGAAVVPALSDRLQRRKPFVIACALGALVTTWPLCTGRDYPSLVLLAALLGFSFLPAYALLFEMCVELSGRRCAGFATGVLMLLGNAGGVVVIVAMQLVKGDAERFDSAVLLLLALLGVAIAMAIAVRETFHHRPAEAPALAEGVAPTA
jgi:cyanate permease